MNDQLLPTLNRRTVVVGGAVALGGAGLLLAGCSTAATTDTAGSASTSASDADDAAGGAPVTGTVVGSASDVPVGSAAIFGDASVVVTQAASGDYAGFSTVCPHAQCNVATVEGASIICPCHNSTFGLDGARTGGPAQTGLEPRAVTVVGDQITLA